MSAPAENLAGDIGQQLQQIVRGELRKMLEVSIPYLFGYINILGVFAENLYSKPLEHKLI